MVQSNICQLQSWERLIHTPEAVIWLFLLEGQRKCEGSRCCLQWRKWAVSGCGRPRGREYKSHQAASLPDLSLPPTHSFTPQLLSTTIHQVRSSGWGGIMENKSPGLVRVENQTVNINKYSCVRSWPLQCYERNKARERQSIIRERLYM